jgi:hypothetical protein
LKVVAVAISYAEAGEELLVSRKIDGEGGTRWDCGGDETFD